MSKLVLLLTTVDVSVLSQISQLILSKDLILRYGIFYFECVAQFGRARDF